MKKESWFKKLMKHDDTDNSNSSNHSENFNIEDTINSDQNSENLKNEIMGNSQSKPVISTDRPTIIPQTPNTTNQTVIPKIKAREKPVEKTNPEPDPVVPSAIKPFSNLAGGEVNEPTTLEDIKALQTASNTEMTSDNVGIPESSINMPTPKTHTVKQEYDDVEELMNKMKVFDVSTASEEDLAKIKKRVRRREKKKVIQVKLFNRFAVALIIFGATVLLLTIIYIIYINLPTKSGSTLPMGKIVQVKNSINKYSLVVTEAETNVNVAYIGSNTNKNYTTTKASKQFTKVKVQMRNNKGVSSPVRGINDFYLVDNSHQVLATCYTQDDLASFNVSDALPSAMPVKGIIEGFLYCDTTINYLPTLEIVSAKGIKEGSSMNDSSKRTGEDHYYVYLGKNRTIK